MTDNSIHAFLSVIEYGSIAEAARANFTAPQTFWKYITAMEAELQTRLFLRDNRTLKLTRAGELWRDHYLKQQAEEGLIRAQLLLEASRHNTGNALRLGIAQGVWTRREVLGALREYTRLCPDRPLTVSFGTETNIQDMLDLNELDIGLTDDGKRFSSTLTDEILCTDSYYIITGEGFTLPDGRTPQCLEDFRDVPFLLALDGDRISPMEARLLFTLHFRSQFGFTPQLTILKNTASVHTELDLGRSCLLCCGYERAAESLFLNKIPVGGSATLILRYQNSVVDPALFTLRDCFRAQYANYGKGDAQ